MTDKNATGRTTRMLAHARQLRDAGRAVYVLLHNKVRCDDLERDPANEGLRFETWDSLGPSGLDERRMRLRGAHPNCVLLVDHHAIEDRYAAALCRMVEYDEGAPLPDVAPYPRPKPPHVLASIAAWTPRSRP